MTAGTCGNHQLPRGKLTRPGGNKRRSGKVVAAERKKDREKTKKETEKYEGGVEL